MTASSATAWWDVPPDKTDSQLAPDDAELLARLAAKLAELREQVRKLAQLN